MSATINGIAVTVARVSLPAWGVWWAEVTLAEAPESGDLHGPATLEISGLQLHGTIISGGTVAGVSSYRIAGGMGGWGKVIPPASYANDAGVKASTVAQDAATACGETLDATPLLAARLGEAYARERAPASQVIEQLAPRGWYVGEDGVTRVGRRPRAIVTDLHIISQDLAMGIVKVDADGLSQLVPGAVVAGLEAVDVLHEVADGSVTTTIYGAGIADTSRRLSALARIVDQLDPARRYRATYEYRVVTQDGERLSLQPVRAGLGMPELRRVIVRPGVPGVRADVALGSRVLVAFVDADPSRPVVVGFEDAEGLGFSPTRMDLSVMDDPAVPGGELGRVVRYGDKVSIPVSGAVALGPVTLDPTATTFSRVRA